MSEEIQNQNNSSNMNTRRNEADDIPSGLKDENIKTSVKSFKKLVEDKLMALRDLATLEVHLPIQTRVRERLKTIKQNSSASHLKVRGNWKTEKPLMHISNLQAKKYSNDKATISFSIFEVDKNGDKKLEETKTTVTMNDGSKVDRVTSAEYRTQFDVVETIESGKPITREVLKID